MLSNPYPESSAGNIARASISRESKSRIALAYSARLSRCTAGRRPGLTLATAARIERGFQSSSQTLVF